MSGSLRARVEVHIGHCYDCSSALDLLKGLEQDLTQGIREPVADKFGFVSHLGNLIRNPVFAYALLILSIYPALSWITSNPSREPNAASTTLPERTFRLSPQLRSVAGPVRVLRSDRTAAVLLQIPFYALMDEKNYSVALDDADGKSAHDLRSSITIGADGMILVLLDTSPLADGEYVLTLVEADKSRVGSATTTNYLFDLQTGQ